MQTRNVPAQSGLYRPEFEHDACGIGALAHLKGVRSHQMIDDALSVLVNLEHRGGKGLEHNTGDGAGILFRFRTTSSVRKRRSTVTFFPMKATMAWLCSFFPKTSVA